MSMPSDMTADITEAMGERPAPAPALSASRRHQDLTTEQVGLIAAAVVAFLGIGVLGPKLTRLRRVQTPALKVRATRTAHDIRARAGAASAQAGRRVRQLGGGTIRR